ncbi:MULTISPECIES: hypothetical protein [Myxococcus]|uniref:hypothetical protein n=1 Tax=Myxococcus TaxID=32 RepID=UPI0011632046|nr:MULTISPECIES: hypothetical protein [Myxococcus]QDE96241.1 hypothetical protein BHS05_10515 [Myxococcus xanthus]QDF03694.1 hypothetical protein BHS04_10860 [Myxococcus xanthus]WAM28662.1 hypothetical protein OZ403_11350 [Myxococcus sp. NMCA1]
MDPRKVYGGVHSEVLVGANADAKAKGSFDLKNGDVGAEVGAGALVGAEASAMARGEFGPMQGFVTGSAIAGVGASVDAKVALERPSKWRKRRTGRSPAHPCWELTMTGPRHKAGAAFLPRARDLP